MNLRDKITLQASRMAQGAVWIENNATALAEIGVGRTDHCLFGDVDGDHMTIYVYDDRVFEAVKEILGGEWNDETRGEHRYLTQEIIDGFVVEFFGNNEVPAS